jgi:hypothetical protein
MDNAGIEKFIAKSRNKIIALELFGESKYLFLGSIIHELIILAEATLNPENETIIRNLEIINCFIKPLELIIKDSQVKIIPNGQAISQEKQTPLVIPVKVSKIKEKRTPVKEPVKQSSKVKKIYATTPLGEELKAKYEIKDFPYDFGCIKSLKHLVLFTHEMKNNLFMNKNETELERIILHLIGGSISSPGKDADITLKRFYQNSRTLLSNCMKLAREFQAAQQTKPTN